MHVLDRRFGTKLQNYLNLLKFDKPNLLSLDLAQFYSTLTIDRYTCATSSHWFKRCKIISIYSNLTNQAY
jgi:hypothetical protein